MNAAWLAGVMDSDGTIAIRKIHSQGKLGLPNYLVYLHLTWRRTTMVDAVFAELQKEYGGHAYPQTHKGFPNRAETARWGIYGKKAGKVVTDIFPFLRLKKGQAVNVLDLLKIQPGKGTVQSVAQERQMNEIWEQTRWLQQKGVKLTVLR